MEKQSAVAPEQAKAPEQKSSKMPATPAQRSQSSPSQQRSQTPQKPQQARSTVRRKVAEPFKRTPNAGVSTIKVIDPKNLPPVPGQGQNAQAHVEWRKTNPNPDAQRAPGTGPRKVGQVGGYNPVRMRENDHRGTPEGRAALLPAGTTPQDVLLTAPTDRVVLDLPAQADHAPAGSRRAVKPLRLRKLTSPARRCSVRKKTSPNGTRRRKRISRSKRKTSIAQIPYPRRSILWMFITVSDLAKKMKPQANEVIAKLFEMGMMVTINQQNRF